MFVGSMRSLFTKVDKDSKKGFKMDFTDSNISSNYNTEDHSTIKDTKKVYYTYIHTHTYIYTHLYIHVYMRT